MDVLLFLFFCRVMIHSHRAMCSIKLNTSLTSLAISESKFVDKAWMHICDALAINTSIKKLALKGPISFISYNVDVFGSSVS